MVNNHRSVELAQHMNDISLIHTSKIQLTLYKSETPFLKCSAQHKSPINNHKSFKNTFISTKGSKKVSTNKASLKVPATHPFRGHAVPGRSYNVLSLAEVF